jgi:tripartite-type tricarboxylate transporter receptor subunit TctC
MTRQGDTPTGHHYLLRAAHVTAFACVLAFAHASIAQTHAYPVKPIRLVVPLAPGGGNDALARFVAKHLGDALAQPVVVENRTGGGGLVGGEYTARATPDGYTLAFGGSGLLVVSLTYRKFDLRELTAIAPVGEYASLLVVHPSLPVKSVAELIRFAKAHPGELNYGSPGNGSAGHLVMEMFRSRAGIDLVHVPYKGAGPALTEAMAGQVSLLFSNPLGSVALVRSGRLRGLAVSGPRRLAALPAVPTIAESGLPGFSATFFLGLLGPAGLPREIVTRLNGEANKALQRRDVQEWMATQGMEPLSGSPEDFATRIRHDYDALGNVIREAHVKLK